MKKRCTIFSAMGEKTFNDGQLSRLKEAFSTRFVENLHPLPDDDFLSLAGETEILAVTRRATSDLSRDLLAGMKNLKGIAAYSTGYEWIDMEYCETGEIRVKYLKDYSTETVAEHTLAMLLSMSRKIHLSNDKCRNIAGPDTSLRGFELRNKKIGIWGYGIIGKRFSEIISGLCTRIFFYDIKPGCGRLPGYLPLQTLLSECDVIVMLADKKRGESPILTYREISAMKPGTVIINSSRSSLADNSDVIRGIREKIIGGYAVDDKIGVFNDPSVEPGRILMTHHTGWYSDEAIERGTEEWVNCILSLN